MLNDLPGDLGGTNPLVNWLNKVKAAIIRRTILPGIGYKVRETTSGTQLEILPGSGGRSSAGITYAGDYDLTLGYDADVMVRKRVGTSQGFYISVTTVPAGQQPAWPEPTVGTVYWHLFCLSPVQYTECSDNPLVPQKAIWVHASDVF